MSKVIGVARINLPVTDEFMESVLIGGYDPGYGSSRYWGYVKRAEGETTVGNISDLIAGRRKVISIYVPDPYHPETKPGETHELTKNKFLRGLERWIAFMMERKRWKDWMLDAGNIDAEYSDMIIQFALFGELVFG